MAKLRRMSGDEAVKAFQRLGFRVARHRGSHVVLRREDHGCVIPLHKELAVGTLRSAIRQAGITTDEFISASENE